MKRLLLFLLLLPLFVHAQPVSPSGPKQVQFYLEPSTGRLWGYSAAWYVWPDSAKVVQWAGNGLPSQTGQSGKFLTTNGTVVSWATVSGYTASQGITLTGTNFTLGGTLTGSVLIDGNGNAFNVINEGGGNSSGLNISSNTAVLSASDPSGNSSQSSAFVNGSNAVAQIGVFYGVGNTETSLTKTVGTKGFVLKDSKDLLGVVFAANYGTAQRLQRLSIPSVGTTIALIDSVKGTIGGGTVTSVTGTANRITSTGGTTPQIDISAVYVGQSSITTLGTIAAGSIPYSLLTGTPTIPVGANPTATAGASFVNGSATTFMRSDAAPKVDSTLFQTVANLFPKTDTRYYTKTISDATYATITNLALKAPLASPAFTGTPTAPTATVGTNTTQVATTAFVLANAGGGSVANPTGTISFTAVNGSATSAIRSDGAPKADSTVIRSVANSLTLSAAQVKYNRLNSRNITQLYANRFYSATTDFTSTGFTPTTSNGNIVMSSGSTTYSKYMILANHVNANENFQMQVGFLIGSIASGDGPVIGKKVSLAATNLGGFAYVLDVSTGIIKITDGQSGGTTFATKQLAVTGIAVNDAVIMTLTQNLTNINVLVEDVTTGKSDYINYTASGPNNLGSFAIYNYQGTMSIQNVKVNILEPYEPDIICIGDSKTVGASAGYGASTTLFGNLKGRWANLISNLGTYEVYASASAETADILTVLSDLYATTDVKGKTVILNIGRNDIQDGITSGVMEANYASIVASLKAQGATVVHLLPIPETVSNQTVLTTYINATYTSDSKIDVTSSWDNATMLAIDGVHPNLKGYGDIASQIIGSGFITVITNPTLQTPRPNPPPIDAVLMHLAGAETAIGAKTFTPDITVNGLTIGKGTGSATEATALGAGALLATNTGSFNTAVGSQSLKANTSGQGNTGVGRASLLTNTTGGNNTGLGENSLFTNLSGTSNTGVGYQTLFTNSTGTSNTGLGASALNVATSSSNTGLGASALILLSSGSLNTGLGVNVLGSLTTGSNNFGGGNNAGFGVTGSNGVYIGHNSAFTGMVSNNVVIGESSCFYLTTSSSVTALGYQSGQFISGGSTHNTTSSNSLYLGTSTFPLADGGTNENVIGNATTGHGSNTTTLGNASVTSAVINGKITPSSYATGAVTDSVLTSHAGVIGKVSPTSYVQSPNGAITILASTQTTLVSGTKALSITGVTTGSHAYINAVSQGGTVSTTFEYAVVCTSGTVTITALTTGNVTNTLDTSLVNVMVTN